MDILKFLKSRRSIRKFEDEPVEEEDVREMIDAARMAPNPTNIQNWHFVVVEDDARQEEMRRAVEDAIDEALGDPSLEEMHGSISKLRRFFTFFDQAPVLICPLHRPQHFLIARTEMARGTGEYEAVREDGFSTAGGVAAAVENLLLAAHALGYGGCWMSGPLFAKDRLEEVLRVEDPWDLFAVVPIGVPAEEPEAPGRKPVEEITTFID